MPQISRTWLLLFALCTSAVCARSLDYKLIGLDKEQQQNVSAWLGPAPATPEERANFLVTAEHRVTRSLEALGYYRSAVSLDLDREAAPWQLQITVAPGNPVRVRKLRLQVSGAATQDPKFDELLRAPPLAPGDVFHHGKYESIKKSLQSLGQNRGYFDAVIATSRVEVEPVNGTADINLEYASGERYLFGEVRHGAIDLETDTLTALQPFVAGDPFELSKLQEFQAQLQRTGYFSSVIVQPRLDETSAGMVPLDLELYPAKRHSFDVGLGYSTDTAERVSMTWRTPRINRFGHSQETRLEYSRVNPSGQLTYNIPLTHPLNDVLQFRARLEENEYGDIDSRQKEFGVRREIRSRNWVHAYSLRALEESWTIGDANFDDNYVLPGFTLSRKSRQGPLVNPSRGLGQYYQVEGSNQHLGADVDLLRLYARLVYVQSLGERHRMVARGELGAVYISQQQREQLAPSLNFFAGGSQSLRGYSYQSIGNEVLVEQEDGSDRNFVVGGDRLMVGSLEYQYYVTPQWRAAAFVDAGDAFDEGEFETHIGSGVGVHYVTPVGAIKLELATDISEDDPSWRVHINIGAEF